MKTRNAWCIVSNGGTPFCINAQYPIYWSKKVAKDDMEYYGGPLKKLKIIRVQISHNPL